MCIVVWKKLWWISDRMKNSQWRPSEVITEYTPERRLLCYNSWNDLACVLLFFSLCTEYNILTLNSKTSFEAFILLCDRSHPSSHCAASEQNVSQTQAKPDCLCKNMSPRLFLKLEQFFFPFFPPSAFTTSWTHLSLPHYCILKPLAQLQDSVACLDRATWGLVWATKVYFGLTWTKI